MRAFLLAILVFASLARALILPRYYGIYEKAYNLRKDGEKVQKAMVEYWSRPDVLPHLPEGMKEKVETYIKQYPEYHYKGSEKESETTSKKRKSDPCNTQ